VYTGGFEHGNGRVVRTDEQVGLGAADEDAFGAAL